MVTDKFQAQADEEADIAAAIELSFAETMSKVTSKVTPSSNSFMIPAAPDISLMEEMMDRLEFFNKAARSGSFKSEYKDRVEQELREYGHLRERFDNRINALRRPKQAKRTRLFPKRRIKIFCSS